ncbi:MAG TPA: hypothetical protein VMF87_22790 [Streptosporangiaceae bacterium]|nr:hypothetical protein [Streptosporangiaceae bacterium]
MDEFSSHRQDNITSAHDAESRRAPRAGRAAKRKAAAVSVIAVAAAGVTALGLASSASASPAPSTARTVNDYIQLMTTSATSNNLGAIEWGSVYTGAGVDHSGNNVDTLVFPGGTYKTRHGAGPGPQTLNPNTCLLTVSLHGTDTTYGGTGRFRGISGTGTWQASVRAIFPRAAGKCATSRVPLAFQEIITGSGHTKL